MPSTIKLGRQRFEICTLVLSLLRLSTVYNESENYGASLSDALICAAIFIGQFERKPMAAGKLASYTGIPRPTVIRRLAALVDSGHVTKTDGNYLLPIDAINTPAVLAMLKEAERLIHSASSRLSKMDIKPIA